MDKNILSAVLSTYTGDEAVEQVQNLAKKYSDESFQIGFQKGRKTQKDLTNGISDIKDIIGTLTFGLVIIFVLWWIFSCVGDNIHEGWRENMRDLHTCQRGDKMGCMYAVARATNDDDATRVLILRSSYLQAAHSPLPNEDGSVDVVQQKINGIGLKSIDNGVELDTNLNIISVRKDDSQITITPR